MAEKQRKLTTRQLKFCEQFAKNPNAYQAAIAAGYSHNVAKNKAYQWVEPGGRLHHICGQANAVKEKAQKVAMAVKGEDQDCDLASITEIHQFWTDVMRDASADMKDRIKCSELRAKTLGAFTEKVEHSGQVLHEVILSSQLEEWAK